MSATTQRSHVLYRFYDDSDDLLYVGITANPSRRLEKHRHDKNWWSEVSRIEIELRDTNWDELIDALAGRAGSSE